MAISKSKKVPQVQLSFLDLFDDLDLKKVESPDVVNRRKLIDLIISHGSGFVDGKKRIYKFLTSDHSNADAYSFLKNEYGLGGRSFTFQDGGSGFWDSSAKGIGVRRFGEDLKILLTWSEIYVGIQSAIERNVYILES